jgi:DNA-binding CsgD family transcriptional regulator
MLVERREELAELAELLTECGNGRGGAALITGPLACGKTELLHAFGELAAEHGALLLSATASGAEQSLPWVVLSQLLHSAAVPEPLLDKVLPLLGHAGCADRMAAATAEASALPAAMVAHRVCTALLELSNRQPIVIAIDDVQFTDQPSLQTLLSMMRRIRGQRILAVLSAEAPLRQAQPAAWTELLRQPRLKLLQLGPLSPAGVASILGGRWDAASAARHAPWLHAATGGNPMLVSALVEDLPADPPDSSADQVPRQDGAGTAPVALAGGRAFRHAVLACLHRGDHGLLEIAQAVAVLGTATSAETLARLVDRDTGDAARGLDILDQAGVLAAGRFRHPLARQAVLDALGPAERARLHLQAALLCREGGASCEEVAGHLVLGGRAGWDWAIPVLLKAADHALAADQADRAVECLRLALTECTDERRRPAIVATLARAQWRRNPSAVLRHLEPLRRAATDGLLSEAETAELVRYLCWHGQLESVRELLTRLDGRAAGGEPAWLPALRGSYQWLYLSRRPLTRLLPERVPERGQLSLAFSQPDSDGAARAAEQILRDCQLGDHTMEAISVQLLTMAMTERTDRAVAWCDALLAEAALRGATTCQAELAGLRAELALRQGELPLAVRHAHDALALLPRPSWGVALGAPLAALTLALLALDRLDEAGEQLRLSVPEAMLNTRFGAQYLRARGHYYLVTGRAHAALSDFRKCGDLMLRHGMDLPAFVPWRTDLAQAHLRLEQRDAAKELATAQLERLGIDAVRVRGMSLRVQAAASDLRRRPALLREAVDLLSGRDRVELVAALADLSDALHHLGEFSRARMVAHRARQAAAACHTTVECAALSSNRVLPETMEAEPEGTLISLSDAERRVASLAAVGHTNREIGRKLFITVSTVEQHLTRVYRKLNVTRRADLPVILHLDAVETA